MNRTQTRGVSRGLKRPVTIAVLVVLAVGLGTAGWFYTRSGSQRAVRIAVVDSTLAVAHGLNAEPGSLAGSNVLLITMDTTRADHLGCYGGAASTPTLDELAHRGVLFSQAITPAPITLPAHTSVLTGLYPHHHGIRHNGLYRLAPEHETLAHTFKAAGYATGAVVSAFVLDARFGLAAGFDSYDDDLTAPELQSDWFDPERKAIQTTDHAIAWLRENVNQPFFLWVHYFDPHAPYQPPSRYAEKYSQDLYSGEIAYMDAELGRLLATLNELGHTDDTLIVAVGDHGEALGEHGESAHGYLLYNPTVRVPLIMACGDRLGGGAHVPDLVSLTDIAPTVLGLLDLPQIATDGRDLTRTDPIGPIYTESLYSLVEQGWAALYGVFDEQHKYIIGPSPKLFDLSADPLESRNLAAAQPQVAADLLGYATSFFGDELERTGAPTATESLDTADLARLQSLGYVGRATDDFAGEPRPDPEEYLPLLQRFQAVVHYAATGRMSRAQAVRTVEDLLAEHTDFYPAYQQLVDLNIDAGDLPKAAEVARRGLALRPENVGLQLALARVETLRGNGAEAVTLCRRVLSIYPESFEARLGLAAALLLTKEFSAATDIYLKLAKTALQDTYVCRGLTQAALASQRTAEAVAVLSAGLETRPMLIQPRLALAAIRRANMRYAQAISVLRAGLSEVPQQPDLTDALAVTLLTAQGDLRDPNEAANLMEYVCRQTNYQQPRFMLTLSAAYYALGRPTAALELARHAQQLALNTGQNDVAQHLARAIREYSQASDPAAAPYAPQP